MSEIASCRSNFHFKPFLWFVCRLCGQTFSDSDSLLSHKLEYHLGECLKIKAVVFEEKFLYQESFPRKELDVFCKPEVAGLLQKEKLRTSKVFQPSHSPQSESTKSRPTLPPKHNPYVQLTRLTDQELKSALNPTISNRNIRTGLKQSCLRPRVRQGHVTITTSPSSHVIVIDDDDDDDEDSAPPAKRSKLESNVIHIDSDSDSDLDNARNISKSAQNNLFAEEYSNPSADIEVKVESSSPPSSVASPSRANSPETEDSDQDQDPILQHDAKEFEHNDRANFLNNFSPKVDAQSDEDEDSDSDFDIGDAQQTNYSDSDFHSDANSTDFQQPPRRFSSKVHKKEDTNLIITIGSKCAPSLPTKASTSTASTSAASLKKPDPSLQMLPPPNSTPQNIYKETETIKTEEWPKFLESNKNPINCQLCLRKLSPSSIKNHVENCWLHNKHRHRFCTVCHTVFGTHFLLRKHLLIGHENLPSSSKPQVPKDAESKNVHEPEEILPLLQWLQLHGERHPSTVIVLQPHQDPSPIASNSSKKSSKKSREKQPPPITELIVNEARPITCKLCERQITSEKEVKEHVKFCWDSNKRRHRYCTICKITFRTPYNLSRHQMRRHSVKTEKSENAYKCLQCSKCFQSEKDLLLHKESLNEFRSQEEQADEEESNEFEREQLGILGEDNVPIPSSVRLSKPHICPICNKAFQTKADLKRHVLIHSEDKPHKCPHCPMEYRVQRSLTTHLIAHHGLVTEHKCEFCGKSFCNKNKLAEHITIHGAERAYKCPYENCTASFKQRGGLLMHRQRKHGDEMGRAKILCPNCGKTFAMQSQLKHHILRRHSDAFPYKCDIEGEGCGKGFKTKREREEHLRIHTGEKPYQCEECGKTFARRWPFKKHVLIHKGTFNFLRCTLCPRKVTSTTGLVKHMRAHEKETNFFCKVCGYVCRSIELLKKHERKHEGGVGDDGNNEGGGRNLGKKPVVSHADESDVDYDDGENDEEEDDENDDGSGNENGDEVESDHYLENDDTELGGEVEISETEIGGGTFEAVSVVSESQEENFNS